MDLGSFDISVGETPATPFDAFCPPPPRRSSSSDSEPTGTRLSSSSEDGSLSDLYTGAEPRPQRAEGGSARAYVRASAVMRAA